jgi:hypothetical protein
MAIEVFIVFSSALERSSYSNSGRESGVLQTSRQANVDFYGPRESPSQEAAVMPVCQDSRYIAAGKMIFSVEDCPNDALE